MNIKMFDLGISPPVEFQCNKMNGSFILKENQNLPNSTSYMIKCYLS